MARLTPYQRAKFSRLKRENAELEQRVRELEEGVEAYEIALRAGVLTYAEPPDEEGTDG